MKIRLNKKIWTVVAILIGLEIIALIAINVVNYCKEQAVIEAQEEEQQKLLEELKGTPAPSEQEEVHPWFFHPYTGYMDECTKWLYYERFQNCDYDGDGKTDRVYREDILGAKMEDECKYKIELSSGQVIEVTKMTSGLPKVRAVDFDNDDELEIIFSCSFDFATKPNYVGLDVMIFDKVDGIYKEIPMPFKQDKRKFYLDFECEVLEGDLLAVSYKLPNGEKKASLIEDNEVSRGYVGKKEEGKLYRIDVLENSLLLLFNSFYDELGSVTMEVSYEDGEWKILNSQFIY